MFLTDLVNCPCSVEPSHQVPVLLMCSGCDLHSMKQRPSHLVSHDEHVDDTRRSVTPVNQPVALVAQRRRKIPRAKPFVPDVVDARTNHL